MFCRARPLWLLSGGFTKSVDLLQGNISLAGSQVVLSSYIDAARKTKAGEAGARPGSLLGFEGSQRDSAAVVMVTFYQKY